MYVISKQFGFSASHRLYGLRDDHPCSRQHGHNYIVEVALASTVLSENGFVTDYNDLDPLKQYIDNVFDHRDLNDVFAPTQTSAENLARHFFEWCKLRWPQTVAVRISETPKTWSEYRP